MLSDRVWTMAAVGVAVAALAGAYPGAQHGLRGTYFRSDNFRGESVARIDPRPGDIGARIAIGPGTPRVFSVVWIGSLVVDRTDTYLLKVAATADCRATIDDVLAGESRIRAVNTAPLREGVYTLAIQCSTADAVLNLGVWWDSADAQRPKMLSPANVFPDAMTLEKYRRLAGIERAQHLLLLVAAAGAMLLALDWALTAGIFGWIVLGSTAALTAAIVFDRPDWVRGPNPTEWQWGLLGESIDRPFFGAVAAGTGVLALTGLAGSRLARRAPRRSAIALIATGIVAGFGLQIAMLDTSAGGWRHELIVTAWTPLGYLRSAGQVSELSVSDGIRRYAEVMPTLAFRATTHPPGGTVMFRALIGAAETIGVEKLEPAAVFGQPTVARSIPMTGVALAGGLIWAIAAALTAAPIAFAAWIVSKEPLHAAVVGLLWLFCPSPTIFTAMLDQLNTLLVALSFALLLYAQSAGTRAMWWSAAGGAIAGVALFFSYGTAPMLATALLMASVRSDDPEGRRRYLRTAAAWIAGASVAILAPVVLFGFPLIATFLQALEAHRVVTLARSATLWLRYNVLDFVIWIGIPTIAALAVTVARSAPRGAAHSAPLKWCPTTIAGRLALCVCVGLLATNLIGATRGEVGRLWMPFMPLIFVAAWTPRLLAGWRDGVVIGAAMLVCCAALRLRWWLYLY